MIQTLPQVLARLFEAELREEAVVYDSTIKWTSNELCCHIESFSKAFTDLYPHQATICICARKSEVLAACIIGLITAGCIYVPVAVSLPTERKRSILHSVEPQVLLCDVLDENESVDICKCEVLLLHDFAVKARVGVHRKHEVQTHSRAYIIFTSGSTGKPKGIVGNHLTLAWHVDVIKAFWQVEQSDRVLWQSSIAFDMSLAELSWAVLYGACLIIEPDAIHRDMFAKLDYIQRACVTLFHAVPTVLDMLTNILLNEHKIDALLDVRMIIASGEPLRLTTCETLRKCLRKDILFNLYGASECFMHCTWLHAKDANANVEMQHCAAGKAFPRTTVLLKGDETWYTTDSDNTGEVCIAGAGLACEYFQNLDLTQNKFCSANDIDVVKLDSDMRLYSTGDVAFFEYGDLHIVGRSDDLVKVNGNRVQLGEIESVLRQLAPFVLDVVVRAARVGEFDTLVAYLRIGHSGSRSISESHIRAWLRYKLPIYMQVSQFYVMDEWPTLPSGKIDRKQLDTHDRTRLRQNSQHSYDQEAVWCLPSRSITSDLALLMVPSKSERILVDDIWASLLWMASKTLVISKVDCDAEYYLPPQLRVTIAHDLGIVESTCDVVLKNSESNVTGHFRSIEAHRIEVCKIEKELIEHIDEMKEIVVARSMSTSRLRIDAAALDVYAEFLDTDDKLLSSPYIERVLRDTIPLAVFDVTLFRMRAWPRLPSGKVDRQQVSLLPIPERLGDDKRKSTDAGSSVRTFLLRTLESICNRPINILYTNDDVDLFAALALTSNEVVDFSVAVANEFSCTINMYQMKPCTLAALVLKLHEMSEDGDQQWPCQGHNAIELETTDLSSVATLWFAPGRCQPNIFENRIAHAASVCVLPLCSIYFGIIRAACMFFFNIKCRKMRVPGICELIPLMGSELISCLVPGLRYKSDVCDFEAQTDEIETCLQALHEVLKLNPFLTGRIAFWRKFVVFDSTPRSVHVFEGRGTRCMRPIVNFGEEFLFFILRRVIGFSALLSCQGVAAQFCSRIRFGLDFPLLDVAITEKSGGRCIVSVQGSHIIFFNETGNWFTQQWRLALSNHTQELSPRSFGRAKRFCMVPTFQRTPFDGCQVQPCAIKRWWFGAAAPSDEEKSLPPALRKILPVLREVLSTLGDTVQRSSGGKKKRIFITSALSIWPDSNRHAGDNVLYIQPVELTAGTCAREALTKLWGKITSVKLNEINQQFHVQALAYKHWLSQYHNNISNIDDEYSIRAYALGIDPGDILIFVNSWGENDLCPLSQSPSHAPENSSPRTRGDAATNESFKMDATPDLTSCLSTSRWIIIASFSKRSVVECGFIPG